MLSELQERILNSEEKKIVIMAAAAAGKTLVLTEKVRRLLQSGVKPTEIAAITFTNMAAEELRQRLGSDYKDGIFIGTIHSLANHFLVDYGIDTKTLINDEDFDELFNLVEENPSCVRKINYLLLDEAQDSNKKQFDFIFDMIDPEHFFVVGDLRQSIYGFSGSRPELLAKLSKREDVAYFSLNENYRNGKKILDFAKRIIMRSGLSDDSVPMKGEDGHIHEVYLDLDSICKTIKKEQDYKNWALLARTNAEVSVIMSVCSKYSIPFDTFKQGDLKKAELSKKMKDDTVKVLTIHSSKGLEWDNVVVIGARFNPDSELNVSYVAATRARNRLVWTSSASKPRYNKYNRY